MLTRTNKSTGEVTTYVYNAANQLTSSYKEDVILSEAKDLRQYTYNSSGATTSDGKYVYEYDAKDHLKRVLNATDLTFVASYTYDYLGRRTSKTTPQGTTRYVYNDISAVLSSESNGKELQFISDANEYGKLISLIIDGTQYFYVYNGNDEIIGLTDSSGAFAVRYSYDSWGVPTEYDTSGNVVSLGTFSNPYMYKTYYYDFETNLYYLNARYYDPSIGRFLSRDPKLGQDDNRLGKNEYIYTENDPIGSSDPDGQMRRPTRPRAPSRPKIKRPRYVSNPRIPTKPRGLKYSYSWSIYRWGVWEDKAKLAFITGNSRYGAIRGTANWWSRQASMAGRYEASMRKYRRQNRAYKKYRRQLSSYNRVWKKYRQNKSKYDRAMKTYRKDMNKYNKWKREQANKKAKVNVKTYVDFSPHLKVIRSDTISFDNKNKGNSKPKSKWYFNYKKGVTTISAPKGKFENKPGSISYSNPSGDKITYHKGSGYPADFSYQYKPSSNRITQYRVQASTQTVTLGFEIVLTAVGVYLATVTWWSPIPDPI